MNELTFQAVLWMLHVELVVSCVLEPMEVQRASVIAALSCFHPLAKVLYFKLLHFMHMHLTYPSIDKARVSIDLAL